MGKQSREKREKLSHPTERRELNADLWERACLFIVTWGAYAVLFTPLIVSAEFFFPFVAPKTTVFRIIIEVIFAAYVFLLITDFQRYRPKISIITIAVTVFIGLFILSSFAGINLMRSFWSTYERMTGLWTVLHLYAFFIVLTSVFRKRGDWDKLLGVSILVGVLLSLYVIKGSELSTRGGGTIGNTSFMAAFLLFSIFFAIISLISNFLKRGNWPLFWQIFSGVSLLIMLPILFTSSARAANIFFWVGIILLALGYLIFGGRKSLQRIGFAIIFILIISGLLLAVLRPAFVKTPVGNTLEELKPRLVIYEKAWKGFLERPILGWGPENFNVVFAKHFNPCMFLSICGSEIWFDRAHNIVLDNLVSMGLSGLLSYLAIFIAAIYGLLRLLPKITDKRNLFLPMGMVALLLIYFAQNLLVFDMINSYLMFFLSLAFINFLVSSQKEQLAETDEEKRPIHPALMGTIIVFTLFFIWVGNIKPLIAGNNLVYAISSQDSKESIERFKGSVDSWMNKYESREYFVQRIVKSTTQQEIPANMQDDVVAAFNLTEKEMEKSVSENSLDFRPRLFLGQLYAAFYRISQDVKKLDLAEATLNKAIELSPTNQQGYWALGETKLARGETKEAVALFQKALDLEPRLWMSHWYLGIIYRLTGDYKMAKEKILEAQKLDDRWKNNLANLKEAIAVYQALMDDAELMPLYQRAVELAPDDAQLWAGLASSYANVGEIEKAKEAAEKIKKLNPSLAPQAEEFLKSLQK